MRKTARGFTLVELLVVISILAILSVIGLTAFQGAQKSARDSKRKADLRSIKVALELYKQAAGVYPTSNDAWINSGSSQTWWIPNLDSNYFPNGIPKDPINRGTNATGDPNGYIYSYWTNGSPCGEFPPQQYFMLMVQLENKNDADRLALKDQKYCDDKFLYSSYKGGWQTGAIYLITNL